MQPDQTISKLMYATSYPNYMHIYETIKSLLKHILTQLTIKTFNSYCL